MRENMGLFRGKREDNGEWIIGYYVPLGGKYHYILTGKLTIINCFPEFEHIYVIPETVGQYTRKELDGKKLFTGDIVETCEDYDDIFGYPTTSVFNSVVI